MGKNKSRRARLEIQERLRQLQRKNNDIAVVMNYYFNCCLTLYLIFHPVNIRRRLIVYTSCDSRYLRTLNQPHLTRPGWFLIPVCNFLFRDVYLFYKRLLVQQGEVNVIAARAMRIDSAIDDPLFNEIDVISHALRHVGIGLVPILFLL